MDPQRTDEAAEPPPVVSASSELTDGQIEELHEAFMLFAKDEKINAADLGTVISALGHEPTEEELIEMLREIGAVLPDGTITFPEFCSVMSSQVESEHSIKEAFELFASNHNGFIQAAELRYVLEEISGAKLTDEEVAKMTSVMDKKGDGMISYENFCQGLEDERADHRPSEDYELRLCGYCSVYYEGFKEHKHCCDALEKASGKLMSVDTTSDLSTEVPDDFSVAGDLVSEGSSKSIAAKASTGSWMPSLPSFQFQIPSPLGKIRRQLFQSTDKKAIEHVQSIETTESAKKAASPEETIAAEIADSRTIETIAAQIADSRTRETIAAELADSHTIAQSKVEEEAEEMLVAPTAAVCDEEQPTRKRTTSARYLVALGSDGIEAIQHDAEAFSPKSTTLRRLIRLGSGDSATSDRSSKVEMNEDGVVTPNAPKKGLFWSLRSKPRTSSTVIKL